MVVCNIRHHDPWPFENSGALNNDIRLGCRNLLNFRQYLNRLAIGASIISCGGIGVLNARFTSALTL